MALSKEYEMLFRLRGQLGSDFSSTFKKAQKQMSAFSREISEMERYIGSIEGYRKAEEELKKYKELLAEVNAETNNGVTATKKQQDKIEKYTSAIEKAKKEMNKYAGQMEKAGISTDKADEELIQYQKQIDKLKQKQQKIDRLTESWDNQRDAIARTQRELKTVVGVYSAVMAAGYKAFIEPAAGLDQSMANVKAYYNASDSEVAALKEIARETGLTTKYTSVESASAFESMAKAGWTVGESIEGLPGVVNLAAASDESLESVTETVVENLNAFKMDASQSGYFADLLSAAAMGSTADVSDLAESLKYTASIASSMGFGADDTLLALGLLSNGGIKGSQAGTSMRRIMTAMAGDLKYEDPATGASIYVKTTDGNGNMRDFRDILVDLRGEMNGMSEAEIAAVRENTSVTRLAEEYGIDNWWEMSEGELYNALAEKQKGLSESGKAMAAQNIAMKTAMSSLLTLVGTSDEDFQQLADSIDNCVGASERMAKVKMDSFRGDIAILQSALEETAITVGDEFLPDLRELTQKGTETVSMLNKWASENGDLIRSIGTFIAKSGPYLAAVLSVKLGLQGVTGGITKLMLAAKTATAGGWITLVGTALVALGGAAVYAHNEIVGARLDERFGDIALSADEMRKAVRLIVDSKAFEDAAAAMKAFDGLDAIAEQIDNYKTAISKDIWKIDMGFSYTEEDLRACQANVDAMMQEMENYIAERGMAGQMAVKAVLGADYEYQGSTSYLLSEMQAAGEEIAAAFSEAFEDGVEVDAVKIAGIMQEALDEADRIMQMTEQNKTIASLALTYSGADLTYDSYKELKAEMDSYISDGISDAKDAYAQAIAEAETAFQIATEQANEATDKESQDRALERLNEADDTLNQLKESGYIQYLGQGYLNGEEFQYMTLNEITGGAMDELSGGVARMYQAAAKGESPFFVANSYQDYYDSLSYEERILLRDYADYIGEHQNEIKELLAYASENGDMETASDAQEALGMFTLIRALGGGSGKIGEKFQNMKDLFTGDAVLGHAGYVISSVSDILELTDGAVYGDYTEGSIIIEGITINNAIDGLPADTDLSAWSEDMVDHLARVIENRTGSRLKDYARNSFRSTVGLTRW